MYQIQIEERSLSSMSHLGEDAVNYAFYAMWDCQGLPCCLPLGVKGCPLGSASNPDRAAGELLSRTNAESGTNIESSDCEISIKYL